MNALWTREQHEWLQAMGHTVWSLAGDGTSAAAEPEQPATAPASREARPAPARAASPERLAQALLRVVGDADALAALGIDTATLRGDAAAKRALWPRLRALRRGTRA